MLPPEIHCISCGAVFRPSDPEIALCPACGGPPEPVDAPARTLLQPVPIQFAGTRHMPEQDGHVGTHRMTEPDGPPSTRSFLSETDLPLLWEPGDIILDLYEVKRRIESGGMAVVYHVRHKAWNLDLAVKTPRIEQVSSQDGLNTFIREAEAWIDLGLHPHIVACHYVRKLGREAVPRVFAEWAGGGSLLDRIHAGKLRSLPDQLDLAIQFAWGLAYAHEKGLVHRDVKPENVLLSEDGTLKVTDFGLAGARGNYYTPPYASPEQVMGRPTDLKTDIWSWAVSLLHLLLSERTWADGTIAGDVLEAALGNGLALPAGLTALLRDCFRDDPKKRPESMIAVAGRLVDAFRQATGAAYPREMPRAADLRAGSLNNKALSLLDLDRPEDAVRLWQEALAVDAHHLEARYNLELHRWRTGEQSDDREFIRRLEDLQRQTGSWEAHYYLGAAHVERGDGAAGRQSLASAQALSPAHSELESISTVLDSMQDESSGGLVADLGQDVLALAITPDGKRLLSGGKGPLVYVWEAASGKRLAELAGHTGPVYGLSVSGDGRSALSCSADKTVRLWDLERMACTRVFRGHDEPIYCAVLTPDGRLALSGGHDNTMRLWDTASGTCLQTRPHEDNVVSLICGKDGRLAISGGRRGELRVWDLPAAAERSKLGSLKDIIYSIALTPDGKYAATGIGAPYNFADNLIYLWDLATGEEVRRFKGHIDDIRTLEITADGRTMVSAGDDRTLRVWDLENGRCLRTMDAHNQGITAVVLSPDGLTAFTGSFDGTIRRWDLAQVNRRPAPWAVNKPANLQESLAIMNQARRFVELAQQSRVEGSYSEAFGCVRKARDLPGYDRDAGLLDLWHELGLEGGLRTGVAKVYERSILEGHRDPVNACAFLSGGGMVLSASGLRWGGAKDNSLRIWDLENEKCIAVLPENPGVITGMQVLPSGCVVVACDEGSILIWDLDARGPVRTVDSKWGTIEAIAATPGGEILLSAHSGLGGMGNFALHAWRLPDLVPEYELAGHTDIPYALAVSGNASMAASGGRDCTVRLWDLEERSAGLILRGHREAVLSLAFSQGGRLLFSGSMDGTIRVWDVVSGRSLQVLRGHRAAVKALSSLPEERFLLSAGADRTIRAWDLEDGRSMLTITGHRDGVVSLATDTTGRYLVSGSADFTLRLWEMDWEYEPRR